MYIHVVYNIKIQLYCCKCYFINSIVVNADLNNEIIVLIPENGIYYIDIMLPNIEYNSIYFNYSIIDSQDIDLYDYSFDNSFGKRVIDFETEYDYLSKLTIEQYGTYDFDVRVNASLGYDLTILLCNIDNNNELNIIYYDVLHGSYNSSESNDLILSPGEYYIGYFNNVANVQVNGRLIRILSDDNPNSNNAILLDCYTQGSEVLLNDGLIYNNT